jgi:SAM-dependent methyltransferase
VNWYHEHVLPRVIDVVMDNKATTRQRRKVCAELSGEVLEVGFGSGLNVPHYPDAVTRVAGVEPSGVAVRLARERLAASNVPVDIVGLDGQRLDQPDDTFDWVLSTWTMCTIPDPIAALGEMRRVLRPGGRLAFVEHGHSPDPGVARWQRRLEPVQKVVAGGCHLTRAIDDLVTAAGFEIERLDTGYLPKTPKPWGYEYLGVAHPA